MEYQSTRASSSNGFYKRRSMEELNTGKIGENVGNRGEDTLIKNFE
jgi:hypothetical protein